MYRVWGVAESEAFEAIFGTNDENEAESYFEKKIMEAGCFAYIEKTEERRGGLNGR